MVFVVHAGRLPSEIGLMTGLEYFDVTGNSITGRRQYDWLVDAAVGIGQDKVESRDGRCLKELVEGNERKSCMRCEVCGLGFRGL